MLILKLTMLAALMLSAPQQDTVFNNALSDYEKGDYHGALKKLNTIKEAVAKDEAMLLFKVRLMIKLDLPEDTAAAMKQLMALHPVSHEANMLIGKLKFFAGDLEAAQSYLQIALTKPGKHHQALFLLGEVHWRKDNYDRAEELYLKALKVKPEFKAVLYPLAFLYYKRGQYKKARVYATKGLESSPENFKLTNLLGMIHYSSYEDDKALKYYGEAVKLQPDSGIGWLNIGMVYFSMQKYAKAKQHFLKALKLFEKAKDAANFARVTEYLDKTDMILKAPKPKQPKLPKK